MLSNYSYIDFKLFLILLYLSVEDWVWLFICTLRLLETENAFGHLVHEKGFNPLWILWCTANAPFWENALLQWKGLSFVLIVSWFSKPTAPLWILLCTVRLLYTANALSHWLHLKGFSPEWCLWWITRFCEEVNILPHSLQVNTFSLSWINKWKVSSHDG